MYPLNALIEQKERMATHPRRKPHKVAQDLLDIKALNDLKASRRWE